VVKKVLLVTLLTLTSLAAGAVGNEHEELGTIHWLRDYDRALELSARTDKPVLILFQEVPGCATCRNYGLRVLSHPLLAEAAEQLFVPVAVFNNRGGADAEVLHLFEEPSWNNPVVRIVDARGRELTRRLAGDYSPGGFSATMIAALKKTGATIPRYLQIAHAELSALGRTDTALLSMFCFWEGELELGAIPGVIATRAGYIGGSEVVELRYDTSLLSYEQLLRRASALRCADRAFPLSGEQRRLAEKVLGRGRVGSLSSFRADENTKYYLSKTPYRFLPMTEIQKTLINIAVHEGKDPGQLLSPRQRQMLESILARADEPWNNLIVSDDFRGDWKSVRDRTGG
jgi:hypothetical protein